MRILTLTSSYPKRSGDATAPFIERIVRAVAERGHEVDVVLPRHPDLVTEGRAGGLPIRLLPYATGPFGDYAWGYATSLDADRSLRAGAWRSAPFAAAGAMLRLAPLLARRRYDVVHAHWLLPSGPLGALAAALARRPLIVSLHGSDVFLAERFRVLGWLARTALRRSRRVVASSGDLAARAERLVPGRIEPIVLPYGVDVGELAGGDRALWRSRLGAGSDEFLAVGLGRMVAKKGFHHLIEAVASLRAKGVPVRAVLAGDGDLRGRLEETAEQSGAGSAVQFLGGISHDEVPGLLAAADAVVVPSVRDDRGNVDGLPNVLMEGLACRRPVLATRVAGIPEVITDGENGLLVSPADVPALTAALERLRADSTLCARLGAAGQKTAERHSWRGYGDRLVEIYREACGAV